MSEKYELSTKHLSCPHRISYEVLTSPGTNRGEKSINIKGRAQGTKERGTEGGKEERPSPCPPSLALHRRVRNCVHPIWQLSITMSVSSSATDRVESPASLSPLLAQRAHPFPLPLPFLPNLVDHSTQRPENPIRR